MQFNLTKHQAYLISIVSVVCIGFGIYLFNVNTAHYVSLSGSNWQSHEIISLNHTSTTNKSTNKRNQSHVIVNDSKPTQKTLKDNLNKETFSWDIDYLIIQAWWPEPEQIYANKTNAIVKHSYETKDDLTARIEHGCLNINTKLREKYFSNSAIIYVGNIDWMKKYTPYCFEFDNIYTLAIKYDDLMYIDQIDKYMNPNCGSKFAAKLEAGLMQRYTRIWLNKLNVMYWATIYAAKQLLTFELSQNEKINIVDKDILPKLDIFNGHQQFENYSIDINSKLSQKQIDFLANITLVWIDFGFKQKHMTVLKKHWSNIKVFNATIEDIHRLHTMNALRYGKDRLAVGTENKNFKGWFRNKYCEIPPVFVAAVMITDYITLTQIIQSYHQTIKLMFNKIKIAKSQSNLNKTCDCFDEEAVFATMLKNHGFDGNETNFQTVSNVTWQWKNLGFTHPSGDKQKQAHKKHSKLI